MLSFPFAILLISTARNRGDQVVVDRVDSWSTHLAASPRAYLIESVWFDEVRLLPQVSFM